MSAEKAGLECRPAEETPHEPDFFSVQTYQYDLPQEQIAQVPVSPRDSCRLMTLDRRTGRVGHKVFRDLLDLLRPDDLLVRNDTRVLAGRLTGRKISGTAEVEVLLLRQEKENTWQALVRPGRRLPPGTEVDLQGAIAVVGPSISDDGVRLVTFSEGLDVKVWCDLHGQMPLPPYITSRESKNDDYQTVYAKDANSAAAPTAGLHFTEGLLAAIREKGVQILDVTLEVGLGTFRPVSEPDIRRHVMHSERCRVPAATLEAIRAAKSTGRRVIAVGTTVVRTLEGLWSTGKVDDRWFETQLFIYPGFHYQVVDGLITNFHLPGSTLMMLVAAFGGYEPVMAAYREAVAKGYRFFSFGDAMFIV